MKLQDFHTHNQMCHHAVGSIEEYIKQAIDLNLDTIGISDHFPYDYLLGTEALPIDEYAMILDEIEMYFSSVESLREKYKSNINVKVAFEVDYIEGQVDRLNRHLNPIKSRLDYIIGSIHVLYTDDGTPWGMDDGRFSDEYNKIGTDNVFLQYYQLTQKMLKTNEFDFDILGHCDVPKKFNKLPKNKEPINNEILKSLELVKKRDLAVEINTSGFRKEVREQYPSKEIIRTLFELDIPVLLGSDAHHPSEVGFEFDRIIKLLKEIGYSQLATFDKRKREYIDI